MSQAVMQSNVMTEMGHDTQVDDFDYKPMPAVAPVAGLFGVCSVVALVGIVGVGLAFVGIFVGLAAMWIVRKGHGTLSGGWLAVGGFVLSTGFFIAGTASQVHAYQHEVPEGFERVSFSQQISAKGLVTENGRTTAHPDVLALVDKPLFLKGFMYPEQRQHGLGHFLLLKDSGECCFGGQPALTDMIGVKMAGDKTIDYYSGQVSVAGTFMINPDYTGQTDLEPLYLFEATHFTPSKTVF